MARTLAGLALLLVAGGALLVASGRWISDSAVVLDQTEIGESEKAFPSMEQDWVEDAYHQAMPFRDPGHISREEIRLEAALRHDGLIDRDKDWSFQQPLWGKYHQVMGDPTHVRTGWTGGRRIEKHSNPLQHAIEQYAYGSEGHREPEEEWAPPSEEDPIHLPDTDEGEKQDRGARNTWEYPLSEDKNYLFLQKQVATLEGDIKDLLQQTQSEKAAQSGSSIRQQLTYRVLKDELVHARLKAQVAEAAKTKEEEAEAEKIRSAKHEEDKVLDDVESEVKRLRNRVHRLNAKREAQERRMHMSAAQAQKDLSSYFEQLDTDTTKKEVSRYQSKLAKLRRLVSAAQIQAAEPQQLALKPAPRSSRVEKAVAQSALAAAGLRRAARQQKLATVPRKPAADSTGALEGVIKSLLPNKSPFLPL